MLNQFIQTELEKLNYPTANQTDLVLAQKIRSYLLHLQESQGLPPLAATSLPLGHNLAQRGYFRCLDCLEDFYPITQFTDKFGRNFFSYLIANRKYELANQLILRWQTVGDKEKLKIMMHKQEINLLGFLIEGIKTTDSHALKLLLEIIKQGKLQFTSEKPEIQKNEKHILLLLKQLLTKANQMIKSEAEKIAEKLSKWQSFFISMGKSFSEIKKDSPDSPYSPILNRLNTEIDELGTLMMELAKANAQESQNMTEDQKQKKALLNECDQHFKTFMGKSYESLVPLTNSGTNARNLRYMR